MGHRYLRCQKTPLVTPHPVTQRGVWPATAATPRPRCRDDVWKYLPRLALSGGGDYYYGNGGTSSPQITPHTFENICLLMKSVKKLMLKTTQLTTTYYFRDCIIKVFSTWQLILFLSYACGEVWALLSFSVTLNSLRSPPPPLVSILQIRQCRHAARWAVWTTISAVTPGTFLHSFPLLVPQF